MNTDTTAVVDPTAESSLADHEQSFHPSRDVQSPAPAVTERHDDGIDPPESESTTESPRERDDRGQFKPRQRAQSQKAGKEDVETINALTKRIRDAEERLGIKVEKQPGESDRVYNLRRRAEMLEAKREADRVDARTAERTAPAPKKAPEPFTEKEPQYEDFANESDQYLAYTRALAAYDRRKEHAEGAIAQHRNAEYEAISERNRQRDAWFKARTDEHFERMEAYHAEHPEAQEILDRAGNVMLTPAMQKAIITAKNSPELVILVAQDQDLRDDLTILTDGYGYEPGQRPITQDLVALVQRRLNRGLAAGATGSAPAPAQPIPAVPRPPNPVRTGSMKTADTPPGDEGNLADHERFYGKRR